MTRVTVVPRAPLLAGFRPAPTPSWPGPPDRVWLSLGRAAIREAFGRLEASRARGGAGTAWFPSLHCGVEVEAGVAAGYRPRFYAVTPALGADVDGLRRGLRADPGPVLLTHFFGVPDPGVVEAASVCEDLEMGLVEDLSHALFAELGGRPVGTFGAAAAASLRKALGAPGGGWLAFDPARLEPASAPPRRARPGGPEAAWVAAKAGLPFPGAWEPSDDGGAVDGDRWYGRRISPISRRIAARVAPGPVRDRRRANWKWLAERLDRVRGATRVPEALSPGASPLVLVLRVPDRDRLVAALDRAGIDAYVFGARPHPACPPGIVEVARPLREDLVGLPVHQGLGEAELARVAGAVRKALGPGGEGG